MLKGPKYAREMLNKFYNLVHQYRQLYSRRNPDWNTIELNVLSVSDCAILFSRNNNRYYQDITKGLITILLFIQNLNKNLIRRPEPRILTSCSIYYGDFNFESRFDDGGMNKEFFYGDAYLNAYLDNSSSNNKINPGECRIKINDDINVIRNDNIFNLLKKGQNHYYFYWMLNNSNQIDKFKNEYNIDIFEIKKDILNNYIR